MVSRITKKHIQNSHIGKAFTPFSYNFQRKQNSTIY